MSIYDDLRRYYSLFGLQGALALLGYRIFGRPKELTVHPPGIVYPVHIRIGTSDVMAYRDTLLRGEYDFELQFTPKTIVDAGANIGVASIYFAKKFPEARIIAIEAEASNFELLTKNVRPYPSIVAVHAALWNRDGEISVAAPDPATGASGEWGFVTHEGPGVSVRATTMRTLMREMSLSVIDLAKIDIEGAEQEVFEDIGWIDGMSGLMIETHDRFRSGCTEVVDRAMQSFERTHKGETTFYGRKSR